MTSDGISSEDWNEIHSLALAVVNNSQNEDALMVAAYQEKLFQALNLSEEKYGRQPSILATRADFDDSGENSVRLWKEAFAIAVETDDFKNQLLVASSLADHFLEKEDYSESLKWVADGEKILLTFSDDQEASSLSEIKKAIEEKVQRDPKSIIHLPL